MIKLNQLFPVCLILTNFVLNAQENISSIGLSFSGNGGAISYSVGQVTCDFNSGNNGTVSQGVQQPYEIYSTAGSNISNIILELKAYPNPTKDQLFLSYSDFQNENLSYHLYNNQGKLIRIKNCENNQTLISLKDYPSNTYILSVIKEKTIIKTFRIIKN